MFGRKWKNPQPRILVFLWVASDTRTLTECKITYGKIPVIAACVPKMYAIPPALPAQPGLKNKTR